jgi:hypothetical protein
MSGVITRPVFWVIMIAMWGLVFPLIAGAYNSINLNTIAAGGDTSERYDRVIVKGSHATAEDAWLAKTSVADSLEIRRVDGVGTGITPRVTIDSGVAYKISEGTGGACKIGEVVKRSIPDTGDRGNKAAEAYTPTGNLVHIPAVPTATNITEANATVDLVITGCKWTERSPIFGVFNGFVRVLMQVIALAGPLGFMLALAYFGSMLIGMATGHPVLRVVMVVVLVLVGAILVNIVLPYIAGVFNAIDGERFVVFDQELGLIAGLLRNFFGVIFVSGIIGSAWSIIGQMRGGTASGSFSGSGM